MKRMMAMIIFSLFLSHNLAAQTDGSANIVGTNYTIESKVLDEKRELQVYLPLDYAESDKTYPVLYVLDGQLFFNAVVSLTNKFKQSRLAPEFIVVGVTTSYPQRFGNFSNGKDRFLEFLDTELIPYIESSFRINDEKLFFGWEYAGSMGFYHMLNKTNTFDAYILASPYPIWNEIDVLENVSSLDTKLFFAVSPNEYDVNHGTEKLDARLTTNTIEGLDWSYLQLLNEEHHSTGYPTLYHGLRSYFKYYPEFQVDSFKKFIKAGGLDYAYAYSKERARRYGFSSELSSWSKYAIIRNAIRANDYGHFKMYTDEFVTNEFIRTMKTRSLNLSDFYEKNGNYKKAIDIYKVLLELYPDSEDILTRTGNAYISLDNNVDEAEKYFQRARKVSNSKSN